ncbi:MAG: DNA mismatch repair protein MutL, partial [Flavobacteriaceae bacterium]|nr:DNA mismatch repair protein MutL [Flavobacteriaceae bacterium]
TTFKKSPAGDWESLYAGLEVERNTFISSESSEQEEVASTIFSDDEVEKAVQPTFQLHQKFIITTIKSGLIAIHQQRAHERILFEEFLRGMTSNESLSQQLLFPLEVSFSKDELLVLDGVQEQLYNSGFSFEKAKASLIFKGLPTALEESQLKDVLDTLIEKIKFDLPEDTFSQNTLIAELFAKKAAVKTGKSLTVQEQLKLVNQLFACKDPQLTADHKTIYTTISITELDKKLN